MPTPPSPAGSRLAAVTPGDAGAAGHGRLRVVAGAALILLLVCVAYFPSRHGGFTLDDDLLLTDSGLIKAPDGLYRFWFTAEAIDYWPVTNSSFWIEWRLWGMDPTGYRVTNVLLHGVNALLIWAVLHRIAMPGAFLAALLFAVHPVNAQSVAWIAQRKNLLAMLFFLLAVLAYLAFERAAARRRTGSRSAGWWYALALGAFVLAMLSKASVAILPFVLLGLVAWSRPPTSRDLLRLSPFVLVSLVLILITMRLQARAIDPALDAAGPIIERVLGAAAVLWFYLGKALLPVHLCFVYPKWWVRTDQWVWWLPLLGALAVTAVLWRYRRAWSRPLLFGWGYYGVALLPVMGFTLSIYMAEHSLVADHYQYLALVGVVALVAAGWVVWERRARGPAWLAHATAGAVVATLALLTWRQSALYTDSVTLFRASADEHPESALAHHNLGFMLVRAGRVPEAIAEYEKALRIEPDSPQAHHNFGAALARVGRHAEAIEHFESALILRPGDAGIENDLGAMLRETGRPQEAIAHFQRALELEPAFPEAHCNLGKALLQLGRTPDAVEQFRAALRLRPDYADARSVLDVALSQTDGPQETE